MNSLQKAIEVRDAFLEERPHMKEYQKQIDEILDKCKPEDRFAVISLLMSGKMMELQQHMNNLLNMVITNG